MTKSRWVVSAFIAWHLVSIGVSSLPTASRLERADQPVGPFPRVTRAADVISAGITTAAATLQRTSMWVMGQPVAWYVSLTGLSQTWAMFWNPPQYDRYWRARYYVEKPGGRPWMATELIGPAHREDRVRLFQSYRDSYRDKAFEMAFDQFIKRRKPVVIAPATRPQELPDDIAPIARFFARRFASGLTAGEHIVRTELWIGTVPNKPIGEPVNGTEALQRRAALLGYSEGPVEERLAVRPYPPYHGVEGEGDDRLGAGVLRAAVTEALSGTQSVRRSWLTRWEEYWFDEIPPQSMALLRIVFGAMALVGLVGLTPVDMYWSLEGLIPLPSNPAGARSWLIDRGLADLDRTRVLRLRGHRRQCDDSRVPQRSSSAGDVRWALGANLLEPPAAVVGPPGGPRGPFLPPVDRDWPGLVPRRAPS